MLCRLSIRMMHSPDPSVLCRLGMRMMLSQTRLRRRTQVPLRQICCAARS